MARYALVDPNNAIVRMASDVDPSVQTKAGYRWLPCPPASQPAYDSALEAVEGPIHTVGASSVTEAWNKRSLIPQELSVRKDARIAAIDTLQLQVLFDMENRVRDLEGKPQITAVQYRAALRARL